ncbi:DUF6946 family protein [Novosphingobium sp. BL-52-GroH]|uniref:DUF6946 family protein n=1 Tax=Novosphingobium sp. BL-52-GroH TaxID=3349877 RepID=UPI00384EC4F3
MAILIPSGGPDAWRQLLAKPDLHWASGYSAQTLAYAWEAANGFPPEVAIIIEQAFGPTEVLFALPEHKTMLPGGRRASQSDVFVIARHTGGLVACTIEGKVDEPFGPTVMQQMVDATPGRTERLGYLCGLLGIQECPPDVHYQLLHRTASALIEAERLHAKDAAMIVHSFSPENRWYEAFEQFAHVLGVSVQLGEGASINVPSGRRLVIGWACGDQAFRSA